LDKLGGDFFATGASRDGGGGGAIPKNPNPKFFKAMASSDTKSRGGFFGGGWAPLPAKFRGDFNF